MTREFLGNYKQIYMCNITASMCILKAYSIFKYLFKYLKIE